MAASIPSFYLNSHQIPRKIHLNPTLNISKFPQKPIEIPSIGGICKRGSLSEAFQSLSELFKNQSRTQFSLDDAYSSILELCGSKKAFWEGQQVHARMVTSDSLFNSAFLSTRLVLMYSKCGCLVDAEKVFDGTPHRTVFTWNAMIGAYVTNGEPLSSLELYREMRVSGIRLDAFTFPCILKACGMLKDRSRGDEIHGLAIKEGYISVVFVANSVVGMYTKCNDLNGARQVFDRMTEREDVVSWNSMISAYSSNGESIEALRLFGEMQKANLSPNTYTFVAALQACEDSSFIKQGMFIHAAVLKSCHYIDVFVANALIAMYARFGKMGKAANIFYSMNDRDAISWNSVLSGFVQNGLYNEALQFYHYMRDSGQKPDLVAVISIVAASARLGNKLNGMEIHAYAIKNGLDSNLQVGNSLVDMYAKFCCTKHMDLVFCKMPDKDIVSWTTTIAGHAQNGSHKRALELFREVHLEGIDLDVMMISSILLACNGLKLTSSVKEIHGYIIRKGLSDLVLQNGIVDVYGEFGNVDYAAKMFELIEFKDVVSWTSMISCYVHNALANEALERFRLMKETGVEPDSISLVSILSAAASLSALRKGKEIHGFMIRKGVVLEGSLASSLVDMYARCGTLEKSRDAFDCIRKKDLILWTSMINAYGMHGCGMAAIDLFGRMEDEGIAPDHIAFLVVLYACSHSGLMNEGRRLLEKMKHEYQLKPWPEHYACLVDLLGRANHLDEAYQFVKGMEVEPTAEVWCALLGACQNHSNKELGGIAAQKLLQMDPENPGNYVLVSNLYATERRWKDVEQVRMRMKVNGLKKNPGCSWIEVGNKVHTFISRDNSHPQSYEIYFKLSQITEKLSREGGYVAQTKFVLRNTKEEEKIQMIYGHSERLAIAYGMITTPEGTSLRITKNLRVCGDCHEFCKLITKFFKRDIVMRDANRFHHFKGGVCSCGDFW